jgi:hypothetical protein
MENVKITPRLVDPNGTDGLQQGEIQQDDTFEVEFLFEDLVSEDDPIPVLSGYTDILFSGDRIQVADQPISYTNEYPSNQISLEDARIENNPARLNEVGATASGLESGTVPSNPVIFTVTFEALTDLSLTPVTIETERPEDPDKSIIIKGNEEISNDDDQIPNTEYGELTIGPAVNITETEGNTVVNEEGETSDTYELVLNSQPTGDVTIEISNSGQVTLDPETVTFTPNNWDNPQEVTVTAVDDEVEDPFQEGADPFKITHSIAEDSADEYLDVGINNVVAQVNDNDGPPPGAPEFEGAPFTFNLDPNQADQFSETIAASDPDGDDLTFSITAGNDPDGNETDAFTIDNDGVITVAEAAELDGQTVFDLTVEASDETSESTANVEINVGEPTPEFNLDVDGNDQVSSLTDGLIIFRHIATNGDTSTYEDNLGSGATVPIGDIETALNEVTSPQGLLDVDGNGQVSSLTDGLIIFRHIATNGDTSTYEDNLGSGATVPLEDIASSLDSLII